MPTNSPPRAPSRSKAWASTSSSARSSRRRFACACLDWSERRPHLGGALGAAWLQLSLRRGWVRQALDGRALALTPKAQREMPELFGLGLSAPRCFRS